MFRVLRRRILSSSPSTGYRPEGEGARSVVVVVVGVAVCETGVVVGSFELLVGIRGAVVGATFVAFVAFAETAPVEFASLGH